MNLISVIALIFCVLATITHLVTSAMVIWRYRRRNREQPQASPAYEITIIRPVCGIDHFDEMTLRSTFLIDHPNYSIIFCAAHANDPAIPLVRALIAAYPDIQAELLIGDDRPTANPKLNNIVKGWKAARSEWIVIADSNVLMRPSYLNELMQAYTPQTGLVCSPPIGSHPFGLAAEFECAFLNGYQARWQCAADTIGFGFAQGKSMLWRRDLLNAAGGIAALGSEIAEDAAATKIVRAQGFDVRLVDQPFEQPLGPRQWNVVWTRQVRWARLRRATFSAFYVPEIFTGSLVPIACGVLAAEMMGAESLTALTILITLWYGAEAVVTRATGWHMSKLSPFVWVLRDMLLPVLWVQGWTGNTFTWRGNAMTVSESKPQARPIAARA